MAVTFNPASYLSSTSFPNYSSSISNVTFNPASFSSSTNLSSSTGGISMDPLSAGIGAVGSLVGGVFGGKGARSAASQARKAAQEQARMVKEANRETLYAGPVFEAMGRRYSFLEGEPIDRLNAFQTAKLESAMDQSFGAQAARREEMARNLALRNDELNKGFVTPLSRFV